MALCRTALLPAVGFLRAGLRGLATAVPRTAKQIVYKEHGQPENVLSMEEVELPPMSAHDVVLETIYSPINPADINMIEGVYPIKPPLPAVGGNEGVARVLQVGEAVKDFAPGDWVIPCSAGYGMWRTHAVCPAAELIKVPNDIPAEYAGSLTVNPGTAYRMLRDFVPLKQGDYVLQNGATSAVGLAVIQLAAAMGVNTINVIRDRPNFGEAEGRLKGLGATHVVSEDFARSAEMRKLVASLGKNKPKLGFNCVGGKSSTNILRNLSQGGTMVTYGGMGREPVIVPTSSLIFSDVHIVGFWMSRWYQVHSREERQVMINDLAGMVRQGRLQNWFQFHKYDQFMTALAANREGNKGAKQVLKFAEP
eukprot:comp21126_c0_seq1/m.28554 comp21126_c0_seq1/g.28554  ORF comp21126_c0_seq1/g.28554 comp21126_c0_seq1/m.28554 type:complete len:365 (-) comp21126_c0_seq1:344-1438(-)